MDLEADINREHLHEATGVYIRAKREGLWSSCDIAELDRESLGKLLQEKGHQWTIDLVAILLGHKQ